MEGAIAEIIAKRARELWRERNALCRLPRHEPDDLDHMSGAWQRVLEEAARELMA